MEIMNELYDFCHRYDYNPQKIISNKPKLENEFQMREWIIHESMFPYFKVYLDVPHEKMFQEAMDNKHLFVDHRQSYEDHSGWKSMCIHGIDVDKTQAYDKYGYKNHEETPYHWTDLAPKCPTTFEWLREVWPYENYKRVRFMMLEPWGFISAHKDSNYRGLQATNVALNNPAGCDMVIENYGRVPWKPGNIFMLDLGLYHAVWNQSDEPRIHMIIHGSGNSKSKIHANLLKDSYDKFIEEFKI